MSSQDYLIISVGDVDLNENSLDKSQIGCYIQYNGRLQDVMVLSDTNYQIKIPISAKASDEDKILILFKKLAGSDDEEPIGRFEDVMRSFKESSLNEVAKKWINLGSNRSKRSSTPLKDDAKQTPRALIYYYFGEKTVGTAAIEQEMSSEAKSDFNSSPFKGGKSSANNSASKYSANKSASRGQSSENRSSSQMEMKSSVKTSTMYQQVTESSSYTESKQRVTSSIQNNYEKTTISKEQKKSSTTLKYNEVNNSQITDDGRTANSSAKHSMILDKQSKQEDLDKSSQEFVVYDIQKLSNDMNKELETQISKIHQEYQQHNKEVKARIDTCDSLNKNSQHLKNESVVMRQQKLKGLHEISVKNQQFEEKFIQENNSKQNLRQQMCELEKRLREAQREIAATNLENVSLKALLGGEQELREDRTVEETHALLVVNEDLKQNSLVSEEEKRKYKKQRELAETQTQAFEKLINDSKQKVQDLILQIQQSKSHNQEQIKRLDSDIKAVLTENRTLKIQKDKQEQSQKQLEKDVQQLLTQEKSLESEWNRKVTELENSINNKRNQLQEVIENLSQVNQEINHLKVQAQTSQYKCEYQMSLKEMYDAHQFEARIRKLTGDIDQSQKKAKILQDELDRVCSQWTSYYEESVKQLKIRIEEMNNQSNLEQIEKLLELINEKDKIIGELQYGINDMKGEVRKVQNNDQELQNVKRECEDKFKQYRRALNDKSILYDQMYVSARQLINRDDIIIKNEEEIMRVNYEIDISKLELDQKKEMVLELEEQLAQAKALYKELKSEIKRLEKRADQLQIVLKQKDEELEQLEEMLRDRDNIIAELERQIAIPEVKPPRKDWYKPIKGDIVDELMAKYLNDMKFPLPVKRQGDGYYMFGTKKIYAKIMQGKLVIRVGGGFMSIEEFINTYAEFEITKVQQLIDRGLFNMDEYHTSSTVMQIESSPSRKLRRMGSCGSPSRGLNGGSPRQGL